MTHKLTIPQAAKVRWGRMESEVGWTHLTNAAADGDVTTLTDLLTRLRAWGRERGRVYPANYVEVTGISEAIEEVGGGRGAALCEKWWTEYDTSANRLPS